MRPRFGVLTRLLAVVFVLAGLGAGHAALFSGHQSTPGHGSDQMILVVLAIGFLVVGISLWAEYLWAWWAGVAITSFTVVLDLALKAPDRGWVLWSGFLVAFAISALQGRRDGSGAGRLDPRG